jgi:hypothetical protein
MLVFARSGPAGALVSTTNCGAVPVRLPKEYADPVLASGPTPEPGELPANTTIWWRTAG